ncbi:hypothetical protein WA1_00330 [Scytonema hofmannii PCC 7110]|uniref:FAD/NAD(P)-binding domain-containing protein n=1 Tax=Scytonema hofmannii PCC 7110 TaxID=128403 RepID=A0A139XG28_9CYAN|nr:hypothetical protein WA1_00330 [Scytonema hofmannii PCC 7110]
MVENLVIIGSGPAGYTAAIYAGRAQLKPLVFEGFSVGGIPGGQLMTTTQVENYPGFSEGIQGSRLMQQMRQQAQHWGATLIADDVIAVDFSQYPFAIACYLRCLNSFFVTILGNKYARKFFCRWNFLYRASSF